MRDSVVRDKSFHFAIDIIILSRNLQENKKEFVLSKQLLRSGTSIGANIREGDYTESKADFIHKFAIAQKECSETIYWLELLRQTNYISEIDFKVIFNNATELIKLLTSIIKSAKSNNHR